jgi:uncharacterized protein (DUF433 family)
MPIVSSHVSTSAGHRVIGDFVGRSPKAGLPRIWGKFRKAGDEEHENHCDSSRPLFYTGDMATVGGFDRITIEPGKCAGKPCIRGMRITVRRVLELLATYPDQTCLLQEYPFLEAEDLQQALRYAAAVVDDEQMIVDRVA